MSARDEILNNIRLHKRDAAPEPMVYRAPALPQNLLECFASRAQAVVAEIKMLSGADEIPQAVAEVLRAKNLPARIHLPPASPLRSLPWTKAAGLSLQNEPPGPDEAAIAPAQFGIAETGTLAYAAAPDTPASWHYRPGLEIAVLHACDIVARFEDVIAHVKAKLPAPSTLNLVTGPSRTADIEQTLELGAHGPKALAILIVKD